MCQVGDPVLDDQTFGLLRELVHKWTGICLQSGRRTMLQGRLRPRLRIHSLASYEDYYNFVVDHQDEVPHFIDAVTTNETYFLRTPRVWNFISQEFLPNWFLRNPNQTLQVWSAAASSGEEAGTLGILFQEFKLKRPGFRYRIFATDISQEILGVARDGKYMGRSIEHLKNTRPDLLRQFFKDLGDGQFRLIDEVRENIEFKQHNLFKPLSYIERFDLVLLRNVLIYFEVKDQEIVLENCERALKPTGNLIIGESESLTRLKTGFQYQSPLIYTRKSNAA